MATDATGAVSTNYSFPKINTAADAPSGVAHNELADAVDSSLKTVDNKVAAKPSLGILIALGG